MRTPPMTSGLAAPLALALALTMSLSACPYDPPSTGDESEGDPIETDETDETDETEGDPGGPVMFDDMLDPRLEPLVGAWCKAGDTCECGFDRGACEQSTRAARLAEQIQAQARGLAFDPDCVARLVDEYSSDDCGQASDLWLGVCSPWVGIARAYEPCSAFANAAAEQTCGPMLVCTYQDLSLDPSCHPTGLDVGEPCVRFVPSCAEGLSCVGPGGSLEGVCGTDGGQDVGGPCSTGDDCELGLLCRDEACVELPGPGEPCDEDGLCSLFEATCDGGLCIGLRCTTP